MSRFKFRMWDKKYKIMCIDESDTYIGLDGSVHEIGEYCTYSGGGKTDDDVSKQYEVMQYTGINDGNGKEIFEGDIIEIGQESPPNLQTVVFREGCFETEDDCENICHVKRNDWIQVVGNVYQHEIGLYGVTLK